MGRLRAVRATERRRRAVARPSTIQRVVGAWPLVLLDASHRYRTSVAGTCPVVCHFVRQMSGFWNWLVADDRGAALWSLRGPCALRAGSANQAVSARPRLPDGLDQPVCDEPVENLSRRAIADAQGSGYVRRPRDAGFREVEPCCALALRQPFGLVPGTLPELCRNRHAPLRSLPPAPRTGRCGGTSRSSRRGPAGTRSARRPCRRRLVCV